MVSCSSIRYASKWRHIKIAGLYSLAKLAEEREFDGVYDFGSRAIVRGASNLRAGFLWPCRVDEMHSEVVSCACDVFGAKPESPWPVDFCTGSSLPEGRVDFNAMVFGYIDSDFAIGSLDLGWGRALIDY